MPAIPSVNIRLLRRASKQVGTNKESLIEVVTSMIFRCLATLNQGGRDSRHGILKLKRTSTYFSQYSDYPWRERSKWCKGCKGFAWEGWLLISTLIIWLMVGFQELIMCTSLHIA
jgi:hypothetical protein